MACDWVAWKSDESVELGLRLELSVAEDVRGEVVAAEDWVACAFAMEADVDGSTVIYSVTTD